MDSRSSNQVPQLSVDLTGLRLLQLADSALPIGSVAHSLGIESLAARELLTKDGLASFFRGYLEEAGLMDAVFCREGWRMGRLPEAEFEPSRWRGIHDLYSALKPARETRLASASLGENFLRAVLACGDFPLVRAALEAGNGPDRNDRKPPLIHHSPSFGLVCGVLGIDPDQGILAYLHQSLAGLLSACLRLMPLGQRAAMRLLWDLKPAMLETLRQSRSCGIEDVFGLTAMPDWGSMEHPALPTRLFIS